MKNHTWGTDRALQHRLRYLYLYMMSTSLATLDTLTYRCKHMQPVPLAAISSFPPPPTLLQQDAQGQRVRTGNHKKHYASVQPVSCSRPPFSPLLHFLPFCLPLVFLSFSFFSLLTFHLPLSVRPPPPAPSLLSYRRHRSPDVWFWAQMVLACLWRWIKPPVSPLPSMCKWSGQRTSNKGKGGRNVRKKKPRTVKQHPTLMFQGIPGRLNSKLVKNCQPAFFCYFVCTVVL